MRAQCNSKMKKNMWPLLASDSLHCGALRGFERRLAGIMAHVSSIRLRGAPFARRSGGNQNSGLPCFTVRLPLRNRASPQSSPLPLSKWNPYSSSGKSAQRDHVGISSELKVLKVLKVRGAPPGTTARSSCPQTIGPQTPRTHRTGGRCFSVGLSSELKVLKVPLADFYTRSRHVPASVRLRHVDAC